MDTAVTTAACLNALLFRKRLQGVDTISLGNLLLDGNPLGMDLSNTRASGDPPANLALFCGLGDLTSGLTLTGDLVFHAITGTPRNRVAYQVKGAIVEVSALATLGLLGIKLLGPRLTTRRRPRPTD